MFTYYMTTGVSIDTLLLCLFPICLIAILFIGSKKIRPHDTEDFLSLRTSKALQGFAAVGIILHHLTQHISQYASIEKGPITFLNWMGILFTSIFFFCSGYGLITSYQTRPDYLDGFIGKRIPKVLIPFLMSNIIYYFVLTVLIRHQGSPIAALSCLTGFVLVNTNTWFLFEIIILYLFFFIAFKVIKKEKAASIVVLVLSIVLMTVSLFLGHEYDSALGGHWFKGEWWYNTTILFPLGIIIGRHRKGFSDHIAKKSKVLVPVSIAVSVITFVLSAYASEIVFGYYNEWDGHPGYVTKFLTLIFQIIACVSFILMLLCCMRKRRIGNPILNFLGMISLELYVIHYLVEEITINVLGKYIPITDITRFAIVIFASILLAIPLHYLDTLLIRLVTKKK